MTLCKRLVVSYSFVVTVSVLFLAGLAHHEFVTEPRERQALGLPAPAASGWGEYLEVVLYAMVPVFLACGWCLMRQTLAPLRQLAQRVERVHADNLRDPLPRTRNGDELDRLTEVFNDMTARLDRSFQQVREFTLHASHELKTPLTVMRTQLEIALRGAAALPPEQTEWMHVQLDEVQRLAKIVDGLTLLTKADAGQLTLERKPVHLAELVRENFEDALILAQPFDVEVVLVECEDLVVLGDRHRLRQLLLNLMDNAVKYNQAGGAVTMTLRRAEDRAELTLTNTGAGIPPELQTRLFERFVRGDEARRKATDGCGLGLTICQWIVQAHGGTIRVVSEPGRLTTASVRLPLKVSSS